MADWKQKLDARCRAFLDAATGSQEFQAILCAERPLDAEERRLLSEAGASIHSESGEIVTIAARCEDLQAITELAFVKRIGFGRPLQIDKA